jgi:lysine 2,3-aminomutase
MEEWQQILRDSLKSPEEIAAHFHLNQDEIKKVSQMFRAQITPYFAGLIKHKKDPLYRQVVPDTAELKENSGALDPLSEEKDSPVPGVIHRYPDRLLFLVSPACASYCRFCTRKRKVGQPDKISLRHLEEGLRYIRERQEVRDVIISGGDPLMLSDERLEHILSSLRAIPHLEILRIGTRIPCYLPQRITPKLAAVLKKYHPLYINVHFNHADEITDQAARALGLLADAGIPLGNQTVLLKGVNDSPEAMKKLMHRLLVVRVRPYYIYQADYVKGTEHLRTTVEKGLEVMESLRGWTSGLAVPAYVIDSPGGGGKIPLLPNYVQSINEREVVLRNYAGQQFVYPQVKARKRPAVHPCLPVTNPL